MEADKNVKGKALKAEDKEIEKLKKMPAEN